jgi:YcaO-like protein with predicted kinase domain
MDDALARDAPAALVWDLDQPLPKAFMHGTHRAVPPEETLARVKPLASAMGITRIGNITGLDHIGIPVALAVRPKSRSVSVSQGKGISVAHAMASALMESAELFHAEDLLRRAHFDSFRNLPSNARVVNPEALNRTGDPLQPHKVIPWIEGYDLLRKETCWVPAETVHADNTASELDSLGHFLAGTNGLASGNRRLEALSAAICELVERDAIALWNFGGLLPRTARRLDPAMVDDGICRDLLDRYERAGIAVTTPTVWHKEILLALEHGVAVYGAASIGALRAGELDVFGMTASAESMNGFATACFRMTMKSQCCTARPSSVSCRSRKP